MSSYPAIIFVIIRKLLAWIVCGVFLFAKSTSYVHSPVISRILVLSRLSCFPPFSQIESLFLCQLTWVVLFNCVVLFRLVFAVILISPGLEPLPIPAYLQHSLSELGPEKVLTPTGFKCCFAELCLFVSLCIESPRQVTTLSQAKKLAQKKKREEQKPKVRITKAKKEELERIHKVHLLSTSSLHTLSCLYVFILISNAIWINHT